MMKNIVFLFLTICLSVSKTSAQYQYPFQNPKLSYEERVENLISLLTPEEMQWLNDYHQRVYEQIAPHLDESERTWLRDATAPLET